MNTQMLNETFMPVEEKKYCSFNTRVEVSHSCSELHHKQRQLVSAILVVRRRLYITLKSLKIAVLELIFSESALFSAEKINICMAKKNAEKRWFRADFLLISADLEEISSETRIFGIG